MENKNLVIDKEKCVHCGLCIEDCISGCLEFDSDKFPTFANHGEERCIKCQHCLAICPVGALSILDKNPENSPAVLNNYNSDELLNLIQSRRSVRNYKRENISSENLEKLKNMLNWVPTGCNFHKLHFAFIEDVEVMDEFRNYVNSKLIKILTKTPVRGIMNKFSKYKDAFLNGEDIIFRGAPHMVVVSVPVNAPCADIDPVIALSYFELYANSLGVSTLWCGFAEYCLKMFPELCEYLEIPQGYKAAYVMLFGNSDVKYKRIIQPESFEFTTVKKKDFRKPALIQKIKRYFWNFIR